MYGLWTSHYGKKVVEWAAFTVQQRCHRGSIRDRRNRAALSRCVVAIASLLHGAAPDRVAEHPYWPYGKEPSAFVNGCHAAAAFPVSH